MVQHGLSHFTVRILQNALDRIRHRKEEDGGDDDDDDDDLFMPIYFTTERDLDNPLLV